MTQCYICKDTDGRIIGVFTKLHAAEVSFMDAFIRKKSCSVRVLIDSENKSRSNVWFRLKSNHMWRLCGTIDTVPLNPRGVEFKYDKKLGRMVY